MSYDPNMPPEARSVSSLDPEVPPERLSDISRELHVPLEDQVPMPHNPQGSLESRYMVKDEPSVPVQIRYFTSQTRRAGIRRAQGDAEPHKDKENVGSRRRQNKRQSPKIEEKNKQDPEALVIHLRTKRVGINEAINNTQEKSEDETLIAGKFSRGKSEFAERRTGEGGNRRKLRDKVHRNDKEGILADKRTSEIAKRRLEAPETSLETHYGAKDSDLRAQQTPATGRWSDGQNALADSARSGEHSTASSKAPGPPVRPRLKLRSIPRRKYQLSGGVPRKRLAVRGVFKLKAPRLRLRGRANVGRGQLSLGIIPEPIPHTNSTPSLKTKPREVTRSRYKRSTTRGETSRTEEPVQHERDNPPSASRPTSTTHSGADLLKVSGSLLGIEEEADIPTPLIKKRAARTQAIDERLYVKRFGAKGGGCGDYGVFSMTPEAEPWYLQDMRREQVHVAETVVTVVVKDINDNAPVFPNATIYGEVQENGPIDLSVGVVWAWDADDEQEGTNAHLTYSIEKNVIEERSGQAIFAINPETGLVRTAICCLDRETTPEYHIQVVAVDGGGLKGTGTVVVRLADVNDNSPRLTQDLWQVEVDETWGDGPPSNHTLLQVTTADHDTSNYFFYRVVEASGWGWQHFSMRTEGTSGHLYAGRTLDYEDAAQRRGFRFMVQVTDRGRGGWSDARHTDTAWVEVRLRDVNDNPPQFSRPHAHVTVREDTAPGTLLASLPATDPDMMEEQVVEYRVVGGWGAVTVDGVGGVRLWRALDRESPGGEVGVARVVAVDDGRPSLSSTATLTITLTDVNDCPPRLLPPTVLHVTEGAPASLLGILTATDDDVWALGHGPPFTFTLAPSNPAHVLDILNINFQADLDSGRGGAEVWTLGPLDREEHRQLVAEVVVTDGGGLAATHPVTVIVDDVNDNPMKPAAKTVYLWKTQGGGADAALGRVYVEDPDDWDLQDKTFTWAGPPHPLFTLQPNTGDIFASIQLREGRYELQFLVSDSVWGQMDVPANVTVVVRYLSPESLAHAVPITLMPTTPAALTAGWTPLHGGGGLGTLAEIVMQVVGKTAKGVEIVSVSGAPPAYPSSTPTISKGTSDVSVALQNFPAPTPFACVWVSVRQAAGRFIDPLKLHGLLALHLQHLEKVMNLKVALEDTYTMEGKNGKTASGGFGFPSDTTSPQSPSSIASLASVVLPLQVVDTNLTSLVTPRLTRAHDCNTHTRYEDETCTLASCLNGGRCVRTQQGSRCICPGGSWGSRCKVLARTFWGSGWAWVQPLPPCLPTTLSLRLLTRSPDALILYSGPLSSASSHPHYPPTPMVALQLVGGQPQVVLEGARGPAKLAVNLTLSTGTWHTLHLHLNAQGVMLMVDLCGHGWGANKTDDTHCIARIPWVNSQATESWSSSVPLQLGGLAHPYPQSAEFGWSSGLVQHALNGCISHLTLNGQLVDLGEPSYSTQSAKGCGHQEDACRNGPVSCGVRGQCVGGIESPKCDCQPGWMGHDCATPTVPVSLGEDSFAKVALSFTPDPYDITLQLRMRTRGHPNGLLMQLSTSKQSHALKLYARGGVMCASISGIEWGMQEVCLEGFPLGDGSWHTLRVGRHGHNLIISVDDSDEWRKNETLASFFTTTILGDIRALVAAPPLPITVDKQDGLIMGGIPEFESLSLVTVHDDLQHSCIDDVRIAGNPIPLPPSVNGTNWGQVTTLRNLKQGCSSHDSCSNTTCLPPLSCHDIWRQATCSCESGEQVVGHNCQDVDECVFQPCLHGGTCYNLTPGYHCLCAPAHTGDNCEWSKLPPDSHPLTAPMAIAALTLSVLIVVVIGVLLTIRLHRSRTARGLAICSGGVEDVTDVLGTPMVVQAVSRNPQNQAVKEEDILIGSLKIKGAGAENIVTPLGLPTIGVDAMGIGLVIPGGTMKGSIHECINLMSKSSPERCSIATVGTVKDVVLERRVSISSIACPTSACPTITRVHHAITDTGVSSAPPLIPQDDLRAYAYEGDGSPSGSLTSTVLGLRADSIEDENQRPLISEYGEVFDLLKNLPDGACTLIPSPDPSNTCTSADSNPKWGLESGVIIT
ncbi:putative neural-cadherin 2 [Procambarus clarkii]|uniref:putative neural-cadherin 2 n=1 Tax=Procambarus clarkii TaxID=6728 RepID=UPI0037436F96